MGAGLHHPGRADGYRVVGCRRPAEMTGTGRSGTGPRRKARPTISRCAGSRRGRGEPGRRGADREPVRWYGWARTGTWTHGASERMPPPPPPVLAVGAGIASDSPGWWRRPSSWGSPRRSAGERATAGVATRSRRSIIGRLRRHALESVSRAAAPGRPGGSSRCSTRRASSGQPPNRALAGRSRLAALRMPGGTPRSAW